MNIQEIMVAGTIKPDGTLELDQKPTLAPGRVMVVLRQETATPTPPAEEGWWPYLQRIRAEREAAGYPFMNEEEMKAHLAWLREGDQFDDMLAEASKAQCEKAKEI
jgi:hypothetical protein